MIPIILLSALIFRWLKLLNRYEISQQAEKPARKRRLYFVLVGFVLSLGVTAFEYVVWALCINTYTGANVCLFTPISFVIAALYYVGISLLTTAAGLLNEVLEINNIKKGTH